MLSKTLYGQVKHSTSALVVDLTGEDEEDTLLISGS